MVLSTQQQREDLILHTHELLSLTDNQEVKDAGEKWLDSIGTADEGNITTEVSNAYANALNHAELQGRARELGDYILSHREHLTKNLSGCMAATDGDMTLAMAVSIMYWLWISISMSCSSIQKCIPIQVVSHQKRPLSVLSLNLRLPAGG